MTGADFLEWLHEQKHIDFVILGVPDPKHPGHALYNTDFRIQGDNETITLPLPTSEAMRERFFVNIICALLMLNRSAEDQGSDAVFTWMPEDKDGGIERALREYFEIFYGGD